MTFGRLGGPGGQHRNKVDTAVRLVHGPTGVETRAGERRRQYENRRAALRRLRLKLAVKVRSEVDPHRFEPSELWATRRQGRAMSVNPKHPDYPALLAEALDLVVACRYDVAGAAGRLGISMSQLAKLMRHERHAFALVNDGRAERGMPRLK